MTGTNSHAINSFAYSTNAFLNESIVALAILQMFLSATIPSIKQFQAPVELLLITALFYACITIKFDRWQILLFSVLLYVTAISFFLTDIRTFLVNSKQNVLAVMSLLYFSKVGFRSKLIFPTFALSLSLLILNRFDPLITAPLINLTFNETFNLSRFGGIFLNAHFNAYFMSAALIYYGYNKRLYGLGAIMIYFTASKFVFVSYLANVAAKLALFRYLTRYWVIALGIAAGGIYISIQNATAIIDFFDRPGTNSAAIILMQVFDPAYYQVFLNPFPHGVLDVSGQATALYKNHDGFIEVGFFSLAIQSGIFLAALYLGMLLKYARSYRVFILVSLMHINYVFSPLIIYMLVNYSREIQLYSISVQEKERPRSLLSLLKLNPGRPNYSVVE